MYISGKVEVRENKKGKAIFAKENIFKEELVFAFQGKILGRPDKYSIQIDEHKHLSSLGNINDNLNHSCEPNGYIDFENLNFKALKNINKNEEITFNYLTTEWDISNKFECKCGSENCIHEIKGFKYLNLEQKKKLEPLLSPYLKKKLYNEMSKDAN